MRHLLTAWAVFFLTIPLPAHATEYEWGCVEGWDGEGNPTTECGYGYWRTLCASNAGVEECDTFFEIVPIETPLISSVLFLPGIKGSRLYRPAPACSGPPEGCAVKLWEPYGNAVAEQLFLRDDGRSAHDDIYAKSGDVLASALGQEFYASFFSDLHEAESAGTFGAGWQWEAGAYDWRLSLPDLITRGAREDDRIYYARATDTPYLETQLRDLAANSPTGKVTIIAHSNGGLVAKALMAKLGNVETTALVDKVIFVGVPHLGAPQSLGALLFGYGEALPFDHCASWRALSWACALLMDRPTARSFALHAPMAYHLLPSAAYFEHPDIVGRYPAAEFQADTLYAPERAQYGTSIDSEEELYAFATAREGGRSAPRPDDLGSPSVLLESFLAYAHDVHTLDRWQPPRSVETYHIVGWGKETVSGIDFYEEPDVLGLIGAPVPHYRPRFMFEGDGVVPAASAEPLAADAPVVQVSAAAPAGFHNTTTYWLDLESINAESHGSDRGHGTLFEIGAVRQLLAALVQGTAGGSDLPESALPEHVSMGTPEPDEPRHWLRVFLHSPLTLELYEGNDHLGFSEDGSFDDQIEDASYGEFGEVKYLTMPAGRDYALRLRAQGEGTFSLEVEETFGGEAETTSIVQVPVAEGLVARMDLPQEDAPLALRLDYDGDSITDEEIILQQGSTTAYMPPEAPIEPEPPAPRRRGGSEDEQSTRDDAAATSTATKPEGPQETVFGSVSRQEESESSSRSVTAERTPAVMLSSSTPPYLSLDTPESTASSTAPEPQSNHRTFAMLIALAALFPLFLVLRRMRNRAGLTEPHQGI